MHGKVESIECLADLFNNLSFDFWAVDSDRRYFFQNKHSCEMWGNVLGLGIDDLSIKHSIREIWNKQLDEVFSGRIINTEYKDHDTGRWFKTIISPVKRDISIFAAVGVTIETTESKRDEAALIEKTADLEIMNRALKVLVKKQDELRSSVLWEIMSAIHSRTLPLLSRLKTKCENIPECCSLVEAVEASLTCLEACGSTDYKMKLSATELQVVNLIEQEKTSKEIAELLHIAKSTVDSHRNRIREKLNLKARGVPLKQFIREERREMST